MHSRRHLEPGEYLSDEIKPFREMFLGCVVGVLLTDRGKNDPHVCFQIIHEDDEHWFLSTNGASSSWFYDYIKVLQEAEEWCKQNCEPDIHRNTQFGWKFKD